MNYYNEIKNELINNEIYKKVKDYSKNKNAGKHYGEGIIKEYSNRLTLELNKKYDISSLNKMKKFYVLFEKMATVSPNLSYSHYVEVLSIKNINEIEYYLNIAEKENCYKMMLLTGSKKPETLRFYEKAGYNSSDKTAFIQWLGMDK